jgi:hypothetical protein
MTPSLSYAASCASVQLFGNTRKLRLAAPAKKWQLAHDQCFSDLGPKSLVVPNAIEPRIPLSPYWILTANGLHVCKFSKTLTYDRLIEIKMIQVKADVSYHGFGLQLE